MNWYRRRWVARLAAPAAFLVAATVAILLVRAGLYDESEPAPVRTVTTAPTTAPASTTKPSAPKRTFYAIRAGDTLESVAERFGTTVEALVELNPGIDPVALTVGQRIRVQ